MTIRVRKSGALRCDATLKLPLSAISVWGQLRDFKRFARQDFFHDQIEIEGGIPRAGARLTLSHHYAGLRAARVGRILVWREGVGFTFSDLSKRGPRVGFPHVLGYRIQPTGNSSCLLHLMVRGRWTARAVPRVVVWIWLWWVFSHIRRTVEHEMLLYQLWRARRPQHAVQMR